MWTLVGIAVGALVVAAIVKFWDDIRAWLINTAGNAIEKVLGYNARQNMFRAVVVVDKVMDKIRSTASIQTRVTDSISRKITIRREGHVSNFDNDVVDDICREGKLTQEYQYTS